MCKHGKEWKVMSDPINRGKHPYHDNRWIVTEDAKVEYLAFAHEIMDGTTPKHWRLSSGSIVCQVMDLENQAEAARLIAAAPELLEACKYANELILTARRYFPKSIKNADKFQLENTCATLGSAIAKAGK